MVPVIAGQRRKLDGVIHGASSSGHTLFVEPLETIDLNNELVRLGEEEAHCGPAEVPLFADHEKGFQMSDIHYALHACRT